MATPRTAGTTERASRRLFPQFSVRNRITAGIALLTLAAMSVSGVLVYTLESARIEAGVNEQIDQEIDEFRRFQRSGIDPDSGAGFTDALRLVTVFLQRNVPDDDEMLVAYEGDVPRERTRNRYGEAFLVDPDYQRAVRTLLVDGGTVEVSDEEYGEVWVTSVPVQSQTSTGALVIVNFLDDEHSELNRTLQTYAIVAVLSLGLITLLGAVQSGRLLAPLRAVRETASDITTTDLSRRIPERGNDDITALTRTFNDMLDRLEEGVEAQRRFLDDAGHELKTPLTVLRGHLELLETGNQQEVERTRALLIDEIDRMSRLVGDLILLAKSRRPDFVNPRPVDLAGLTESLFAKCRGLGDRAWTLDATGRGTVSFDEQRITQAVLQLADNAVKHTDPGDPISLGSAKSNGVVRLWVQDSGHGVRLEDRERIFERFERATVRYGDEGFGLGLSIVRAIVEAHGGTITVVEAPPRGARFDIELPTEEGRWHTS
jgi:two-component system, OmpR family, sensor kinase